jgi:hypothetical protein
VVRQIDVTKVIAEMVPVVGNVSVVVWVEERLHWESQSYFPVLLGELILQGRAGLPSAIPSWTATSTTPTAVANAATSEATWPSF